MSEKRTVGSIAAIAGPVIAVALVVGAAVAAADELSDLRANSELLQRRLDQIENARAGAASGGRSSATPSPAAAGGSFPRSFVVPGSDTSIRVGGNISETFSYRRR